MINILFWNTDLATSRSNEAERINNINNAIINITNIYMSDIIVLAEYSLHAESLANILLHDKGDYKVGPIAEDTRVKLLVNSRLQVELVRDSKYYFICYIENYSDMKFILAGIHMPSKLKATESEQALVVSDLIRAISEAKNEVGIDTVLIVGDFNANPFETMILSANGLHAIPYADIVEAKRNCIIYGKPRELYYNPMWNFLGDYQLNNGLTYYYSGNGGTNLYRNIFDQVIFSASMVKYFEKSSLVILKNIGEYSFLDSKGIPARNKFSDHLPIVFNIKEEI